MCVGIICTGNISCVQVSIKGQMVHVRLHASGKPANMVITTTFSIYIYMCITGKLRYTDYSSHTYLHTSHFVEKSLEMITSGAIQGYVPAPVIWVVCSISRARPKSVILIVLLYRAVGVMALARRTAQQNAMVTITHRTSGL